MTSLRPAAAASRSGSPRIAVVDYGAGNLVSIAQGLSAVGASVSVARRPDDLERADGLVVPGVGAAAPAMRRLERAGLRGPIVDWIASDRPFLGICLGLQLLFDGSDEDGATTLGILRGRSVRLAGAPTLPHIGWNQVERRRDDPLFSGIASAADMYFVHSYAGAPEPVDHAAILAETEHGSRFVSAVNRGRMWGVQFHPERSGTDGLRLLRNFAALVAAA
jgi:imidazole glycerol phosphate synthase glutamine amidotransferase subunit